MKFHSGFWAAVAFVAIFAAAIATMVVVSLGVSFVVVQYSSVF